MTKKPVSSKKQPTVHQKKHHDASIKITKAYKFGIPGGAVFLRKGKATKLLEYKNKKVRDNLVKCHDNGTFEFIPVADERKPPARVMNSGIQKNDEVSTKTNSQQNKNKPENVVYKAIKETTCTNNVDNIAVAAMPEPKESSHTTNTKKGGKQVTRVTKRSKITENWMKFPFASVVAINGTDMDEFRWKDRKQAPIFYGVVGNPYHFDCKDAENIDEKRESMVTFVLNGHYEWLDSDLLNVMSYKYANRTLQIVSYPPVNPTKSRYKRDTSPMRDFQNTEGKWTIINHHDACLTCASPWCLYMNNKKTVDNIVEEVKNTNVHEKNNTKRFNCYVACARHILEDDNTGNRIRLGYCILKFVRAAFPENDPNDYTGFKYGKEIHQYPGNESDTS